jgi:uroporphyrin-III C-methyltransferase / precorrin-2 dehydrogenase / sirohydrochlorin ferrochelatase
VSYYPVSLDLRGKRCVLLGGSELAAGKLPLLLEAEAELSVIAAEAVPAIEQADRSGAVRWLRRAYRPGDLAGARLVIDASDDPETNRLVRQEADRERALLNVVDRTPLCDWIAPAVVNRGPLKIAISTAGQSPFLAAAMRRRLETVFGQEWGPFTSLVGALRRQLRGRGVPLREQERIYRQALRSDARRLLREGREAEARALLERLATGPIQGRVTIAGAGPGAAELLTEAVREVLYEADVVFHDALVEPEVLALCGPRTRLVDVGKRAGGRRVPQEEINRLLVEAARAGRDVVRLKGGDPFIFGRGGEELTALVDAGVDTRVLPGVSAATAAPTLAGIPLTLRGVAGSVAFATAQLEGGPARLQELARSVDTLVILMAFERAPELARELIPVLGEQRPVALVASASTDRERTLVSTLGRLAAEVAATDLEPPALLVVGEVVAAAAARSERERLVG